MADLSVKTIHKSEPGASAGQSSYPVANGVTVPIGALVQLQSGFLNHYDHTGFFLGVMVNGDADEDGIVTGDTSATPQPLGTVDESGVVLMHVAVASATVAGVPIWCADSNPGSFTITDPTTYGPIGWLKKFRSASDCDVQLFTPGEAYQLA